MTLGYETSAASTGPEAQRSETAVSDTAPQSVQVWRSSVSNTEILRSDAGRSRSGAVRGRGERARESDVAMALGLRIEDLETRIGSGAVPPLGWDARCGGGLRSWKRGIDSMRSSRRGKEQRSCSHSRAGYWLAAAGWPLAKGRDTWDYLAYYLQLGDSDPPSGLASGLSNTSHATRAGPADGPRGSVLLESCSAPLCGRDRRLERHRAHLRTSSRAPDGHPPARLSRLRDALPPGLERRDLRHGPRGLGARPRPDVASSFRMEVRRARGGNRGARPDPASNQVMAATRIPAAPGVGGAPARLVGGVPRRGRRRARPLGVQCGSLRRAHRRARWRVGALPPRLPGRPDHLAGEQDAAAPGRSDRGRGAGEEPHAALDVPSTPTSGTGRTTRPCA